MTFFHLFLMPNSNQTVEKSFFVFFFNYIPPTMKSIITYYISESLLFVFIEPMAVYHYKKKDKGDLKHKRSLPCGRRTGLDDFYDSKDDHANRHTLRQASIEARCESDDKRFGYSFIADDIHSSEDDKISYAAGYDPFDVEDCPEYFEHVEGDSRSSEDGCPEYFDNVSKSSEDDCPEYLEPEDERTLYEDDENDDEKYESEDENEDEEYESEDENDDEEYESEDENDDEEYESEDENEDEEYESEDENEDEEYESEDENEDEEYESEDVN